MTYSQRNQDPLQIIQGNIEIWSPLRAELKSSDSIDIVSDEFLEKTILSTSPAIWNWLVTANKGGKQTLILSIILPLPDNPPILLAQMDLEIFVEELPTPTPMPAPTQTLIPTSTSIPSIGQQLTGSAVEVMAIVIPAIATIIVTTIGVVLTNKSKAKKEEEQQKEQAKNKENAEKVKRALDTSKAIPAKSDKPGKQKTKSKK